MILVHKRIMGTRAEDVVRHEYFLVLTVRLASGDSLLLADVHLPPSINPARRRNALWDLGCCLLQRGSWVSIVGGDFNDLADSGKSTWLNGAMGKRGPLEGFLGAIPTTPSDKSCGQQTYEVGQVLGLGAA